VAKNEAAPDFLNWFKSANERRNRERMMERSGIPLELRARRNLRQLEYSPTRAYYEKEGVSHEIDFLAYKEHNTIELPHGFELLFDLTLIGDCKHSETHDLFLFKAEDPIHISLSDFPLRLCREQFPDWGMVSIESFFKFPLICERVVEVDAKNYPSRKNGNYQDRMTYQACENLADAYEYYRRRYTRDVDELRSAALSEFLARHAPSYLKEASPVSLARRLAKRHTRELYEALNASVVSLAFPFLVVDDNRGLVETMLNNDGQVRFLREAGVALYPHVPRTARMRSNGEVYRPTGILPVVICRQSCLPEAVSILELGIQKLTDGAKKMIHKDPTVVLRSLILAEIGFRSESRY
jgi:hypothetical protein